MNKILPLLWLTYGLLATVNAPLALAQTGSNKGTEFWTVFPTHESDVDRDFNTLYPNYSLFITSDQASSGIVTVGAFTQIFVVAANAVTEVKIPRNAAYIDQSQGNKLLPGKAIHILVDPGQPKVVVYAHIFAGQRSAASLILPKEALGRQYLSINYQQHGDEGKNYILIVATEPDTKISIRKGTSELIPGGVTLAHVNDVYEYLSDNDLTGVSVSVDAGNGCNRFALFSGSTGVSIGTTQCSPNSLDPLFQQNYAVENWGLSYGFIPFSTYSPHFRSPARTTGQYIRIVAKDQATAVKINGALVATLNSGEFYTSPSPLTVPSLITADKPIAVAQYALSQSCSNTTAATAANPNNYSDPDMVILNPLVYAIKKIAVYSSTKENISEQYLNILIRKTAAASFRINDSIPVSSFLDAPNIPGYAYLQLNLNSYKGNTFNLTADDGFNAIAYGFGNVESYAYSAGTNLSVLQTLSGVKINTDELVDTACINDDFYFKLALPYPAAQLSWKMDDHENAIIQQNPAYQLANVNGNISYEYRFSRTAAYQNSGTHHIQVLSFFPQTGTCNAGSQQVDYDFFVKPLPLIDFKTIVKSCANTIDFSDQSKADDYKIIKWHWDFGDQNAQAADHTSDLQNPTHTYQTGGIYQVTLTVSMSNGCQQYKTVSLPVTGSVVPQVRFDALPAICLNVAPFMLTQGKEISGAPGQGSYDGPGVKPDGTFDPAAAGLGLHEVHYTYVSITGCEATAVQTIMILPVPSVANKVLQINEGETITLQPAYQGSPLTYSWFPAEGLNRNDIANPKAQPSQSTTYTVTVSNGSCSSYGTITVNVLFLPQVVNTFTPNGDGVNDLWKIKNIENFPEASVTIYNRYGIAVYRTIGAYTPWDGRYHNIPVPSGTYYYLIQVKNHLKPLAGQITLIR